MREALTLLFLIVSYNFLLWYITEFNLSPVPLFPKNAYHVVLVLAYNSVLYISWLFGERHRVVQWIGYLFFFQIVALSIYFGDLGIIVRDLPPVILTFALVVLFESPTEREIRNIEKEREELIVEIDRIRREREKVEVHLRMLQSEIKKIEEEKKKEEISEEALKELEEKLQNLQKEIKEYKEKEKRLLEANRKLFQLLDMLRSEAEVVVGRGELSSLRKERKKLIKELLQLQELVDIYSEENEKLKEENYKLRRKLEEMSIKLGKLEIELESAKSDGCNKRDIYRNIFTSILQLSFSDRAMDELIKLPADKTRLFLRELFRLSQRIGQENIEPLASLPEVYKLRFAGGRIYLRRRNGSWEVVGLLDSEDDKEKERYIRRVLSKIVN